MAAERRMLPALVLAAALALAACGDGDGSGAEPDPEGDPALAATGCLEAGSGDRLHLTAPDGWTDFDDPALDAVAVGEIAEGYLPRAGLVAFEDESDEDDSDADLVLTALTFVTEGAPLEGRAEAEQQLAEGDDAEVTLTSTLSGDPQRYTAHAELRTVGDTRFGVVLLAPEGAPYDDLAAAVLPTVAEGACPA